MSVVKINAVTVPEGTGDDFMERFAKRAELEKQVNANLGGMGYGG